MSHPPQFPHLPAEAWSAFLRDELGDRASTSLEKHLADCAECRLVLESHDPSRIFSRLRDLEVRADKQEDLWEGFFDGISQTIQQQEAAGVGRFTSSTAPVRKMQSWREQLSYLAGAASFLLAVLVFQGDGTPSQHVETFPCPPAELTLASVQRPLSCDEHRLLFDVRFDAPSEVLVQPQIDLGTL